MSEVDNDLSANVLIVEALTLLEKRFRIVLNVVLYVRQSNRSTRVL